MLFSLVLLGKNSDGLHNSINSFTHHELNAINSRGRIGFRHSVEIILISRTVIVCMLGLTRSIDSVIIYIIRHYFGITNIGQLAANPTHCSHARVSFQCVEFHFFQKPYRITLERWITLLRNIEFSRH